VLIVDLGLPDGSGLDLIRDIAAHSPRVPVLLATSGDASAEGRALAAGADAFLPKPIESLSAFRTAILSALPSARPVTTAEDAKVDLITPDPLALRDDLAHAACMLSGPADEDTLDYVARFLSGLALSAHDAPLQAAAEALARDCHSGDPGAAPVNRINGLVRDRLAAGSAF
jgi:CheY-like chemotaxis protein